MSENIQNTGTSVINEDRYISFSLSGGEFATPLLAVREVIGYVNTTPIPGSPAHFRGIINLRGQVISVLDLRTKLKLAKAEFGPETSIIILNVAGLNLGIVVDSVNSVLTFRQDEISPPPQSHGSSGGQLLGVAKREERLILLLDASTILSGEDLHALKKQTAA